MVIDFLFLCLAVVLVLMIYELREKKEYIFSNMQYAKNVKRIKHILATELLKRGSVLKNAVFVRKKYNLSFAPKYIFCEKQKLFILKDKICSFQVGVINFTVDFSLGAQKKSINFENFMKTQGAFVNKIIIGEYQVFTTISNSLQITFKVENLIKKRTKKQEILNKQSQNLKIRVSLLSQNIVLKHTKSRVQIGKINIKYTCSHYFLKEVAPNRLSLIFSCNFARKICLSLQFLRNKEAIKCQTLAQLFSIKYYDKSRQFLSMLAVKTFDNNLSNFAHFDKVKKVCKQLNLDYEKCVFFTLFTSRDYENYKAISRCLALYKLFDKTPIFFYKNVHFQDANVRFFSYYSAPLCVINFLLENGNKSSEILCKTQSKQENTCEAFFDLKTQNFYQFFDADECPNFQNYANFRKLGNSLKLENSNEKVYYNFSCSFKNEKGKIIFSDACVCAIKSSKLLKKTYYECLIDKAQTEAKKMLFINFWQDEKPLKNDIESAISLCPAIALIYLQDKPYFLPAFESFYSKYKDLTSRFIMFYYLCKYVLQTDNGKQYVVDYANEILQNLRNCFLLSKNCRDYKQKILLYLHSKNLQQMQIFFHSYNELNQIITALSKEIPYINYAENTSFDNFISAFAPSLFNYEYLLDYLLEIKGGYFRFKSNICTYENMFKLNYNDARVSILLHGNKLRTIHSNLQVNENLFIPLNLQGVSNNLKIN